MRVRRPRGWVRSLALTSGFLLLALAGCDDSSGGNNGGTDTGSPSDTGDDNDVLTPDGSDATGGDTSDPADGTDTADPGDGTDTADTSMCASDRVCGSVCCDSDEFCINGACRDTCVTGITCGETGGLCCGSTQSCLPDDTCGLACPGGTPSCGTGASATCCDAGQVCNNGQCALDCTDAGEVCNGVCCGTDEMCYQDSCVADCANPGKLCGVSQELCCADAEVCLGGTACVEPGDSCTLTEQCAIDEYCEPTLGACVPRDSVEVCEFRPPVGEFSPAPGCTWNAGTAGGTNPGGKPQLWGANSGTTCAGNADCSGNEFCSGGTCRHARFSEMSDVVMTPVVVNVTDDNNDGVTDTNDVPDIIFSSFSYAANGCCTNRAILRIVSGACNPDGTADTPATMNTIYTFDEIWIDNSGGIAVANLHPATMADETVPEIVATSRSNGVFALRRTADDGSAWEVMWHNATVYMPSGATPSIADLDRDGQPEVVVGNVVLNGLDGALLMDGATLEDPATMMVGTGGVGYNSFLGPSSTVADVDLDGTMEIIAGNSVYEWTPAGSRIECTYTFTTSNSACQGGNGCDGFNAVGDFDADPEGELVLVREGQVIVLNHDCSPLHIVDVPRDDVMPYLGDGPCARNESGPPTVADFDGDGEPEIGTAGADFYTVVDLQCVGDPLPVECYGDKILWVAPNHDCSSRSTASSVFDFEGDGKAEVVYADEQDFFVLRGTDGSQLFVDDAHSSNTRIEMPVVVDVDNDGKSEVIVAKATGSANDEGITVWQDADNNWVRTRRIWNQHGYHVTNVTENGQVPNPEEVNWLNTRLNNYRQNVQPGGLFDAPDLTVEGFAVDISDCASGVLHITVTVGNNGALGVPAGILVHASLTTSTGNNFDLGAQPTTMPLLPGQTTDVTFDWSIPSGETAMTVTVTATVDDDGMGASQYNECDENNNAVTSAPLMSCPLG